MSEISRASRTSQRPGLITKAMAAFIVASSLVALPATGAFASQPATVMPASVNDCSSQSAYAVARWYSPRTPYAQAPLRCGTTSFGLAHLQASGRWNSWFEDMISITLGSPTRTAPQGTATRFELDITDCPDPYVFIVIVEWSAQSDGLPKGIITAYQNFDAI